MTEATPPDVQAGSFRDGRLVLDRGCVDALEWLDRVICDLKYGRPQPHRTFEEIDAWFNDGRYWSDACNTRWKMASALYHMASHPQADGLGELLFDSLEYRDDWSNWSGEKQAAVRDALAILWRWLLEQPATSALPGQANDRAEWATSFGGRIFEFARQIEAIDGAFLEPLFKPEPTSNRFLYECLFVEHYSDEIRNGAPVWMRQLPSKIALSTYLQAGFFVFPEHEAVASSAEQLIAWDRHYATLITS